MLYVGVILRSWGLLGALGVVLGGPGGRLIAPGVAKGRPRSHFGVILKSKINLKSSHVRNKCFYDICNGFGVGFELFSETKMDSFST